MRCGRSVPLFWDPKVVGGSFGGWKCGCAQWPLGHAWTAGDDDFGEKLHSATLILARYAWEVV